MREFIASIWARMSSSMATGLGFAEPIRRGPVLWLTLCGGLLVAAIFAGTIMMVDEFRGRALSNSERELENTVMLLARHFEQQFDDSETVVAEVIAQMQISDTTSPEIFRERMSTPQAHHMLQSKISALSYIGDVAIFDAEGKLLNWSRPSPVPDISIVDRAYFKIFKSDPQSEPMLVEPARSYIDGSWTTVIAHRLSGPGGVFLGVMSRRIDPGNYERFFASLTLGEGAAVAMFHRDGTMLARYPHIDAMIGQKFENAPLLHKILTLGGGQTLRMKSPVDGQDRLGAGVETQPFPGRRHRHHYRFRRTGRLARANPFPGDGRGAVGLRDRADAVFDHPADQPAEPGGTAAAGIGKAAA